MTFYIAVHATGATATWYLPEGVSTVHRVDGAQESVDIPPGISSLAAVQATRKDWSFHILDLGPGEYYPRMSRPNSSHPSESPGSNPVNYLNSGLIETGRGQLVALRSQMESIFRVVHPCEANFLAFGHDIRNLLILAATEVEAHWKGVLKANGAKAENTRDYVKLADVLRLKEYSLRLPFYPWLPPIKPFADWVPSASPTKDLPWYDAYQAVKHDRENEFEKATLLSAIQAVCGCAVMLFAQFGAYGFHYRQEINSFFEIEAAPAWHPGEVYSMEREGRPIKPVMYPF